MNILIAYKKHLILALAVIAAVGGTAYFSSQYAALKQDPQQAARKELSALIARVGELMVLPADEEPTMATVSDPDKLKGQPFFARAKKGDKVLIYAKEKKAILYDPAAHRIVDVAPVSIGASAKPSVPSAND